jgi:dihydrofolate synthase/folylpolyglutamate synthase
MHLKTLEEWSAYVASIHPKSIELGLTRVTEVAQRLNLLVPGCSVITIAGTNGKGSCVAGLEAIYIAAGYRVGSFTSPYILRLNEEVKIQGEAINDEAFVRALNRIEAARGEIILTTFEFNTLAALEVFRVSNLDVIILEVGLGGRLDAVNIIDPDLAVISSIAIDHAEWLGDTREKIAGEKAGIFRAHKPVVIGDFDPPVTLTDRAKELSAPMYCQNEDFRFVQNDASWIWESETTYFTDLPLPTLALQNMSTVLMAVEVMQKALPVKREAIYEALTLVGLPARIQVVPGSVTKILDVSHNPAAAEFLAQKIVKLGCAGKTRAVFSMLADKDIVGTIQVMKKLIDVWHIAALPVLRGTTLELLQETFRKARVEFVISHPDIVTAYQAAVEESQAGDRVIVFGSFYTVAGVMPQLL